MAVTAEQFRDLFVKLGNANTTEKLRAVEQEILALEPADDPFRADLAHAAATRRSRLTAAPRLLDPSEYRPPDPIVEFMFGPESQPSFDERRRILEEMAREDEEGEGEEEGEG